MQTNKWQEYVDRFNANDEELTQQIIPNERAMEWISKEVPYFECSDPMIEETYYYRWWVFRKHIKQTPEGRIITEFLPSVYWAGPYNSINCAAGHHLAEARWMRSDKSLGEEYIRFWFQGSGDVFSYSSWIIDSVYQYVLATGEFALAKELLPEFIAYYRKVEQSNMTRYGLFWSYDDRDAMEMSISGSGLRPTLNSYMYANAQAIARIAGWAGNEKMSSLFSQKAEALRQTILSTLWDPKAGFFKVVPQAQRDDAIPSLSFDEIPTERNVRESIGFIPWSFGIPGGSHHTAWEALKDEMGFAAPFGPTTAERRHPGFMKPCSSHECLWNGPSWPFSTTQVLNSMIAALHRGETTLTKEDFLRVMSRYAASHNRKKADGTRVNWLDENLEPDTGEWLSRRILEDWGWPLEKAGRERGKDYNHSAFCDLVIRGICGVQISESDQLCIEPLLPDGAWDYFMIRDLPYKGKWVTIGYDREGSRYGKGVGLWVDVDGKRRAESKELTRVNALLA